jgi:predicted MPP superfamily phosphohydrolase
MCTELILACIYFVTIFIVNIFLYKLLKNYFQNILYLLKLKNIFNNYKNQNLSIISLLYFYFSKDLNFRSLLKNFSNIENKKDVLIIGNIYKNLNNRKNIEISIKYYLDLLEKQYL